MKKTIGFVLAASFLVGCAGIVNEPKVNSTPMSPKASIDKGDYQGLKRKVAIARFGAQAKYGSSDLFGVSYDVSKQATDILSSKLTESGKFIMLERSDLDLVLKEQNYQNISPAKVGADYLLVGSITEFGRKERSEVGVFSRTKIQTAYAGVSVRIVDTKTGQIIYGTNGSGEAQSEAGKTFGIGAHQGYDATLNDRAIAAAMDNVINKIMQNLMDKPWRSYILSSENGGIIMAGGKSQNIKVGDKFGIFKQGKKIKNPQTGMLVELPGAKIAEVQVVNQSGTNYTDEISIATIISGNLKGVNLDETYISN